MSQCILYKVDRPLAVIVVEHVRMYTDTCRVAKAGRNKFAFMRRWYKWMCRGLWCAVVVAYILCQHQVNSTDDSETRAPVDHHAEHSAAVH